MAAIQTLLNPAPEPGKDSVSEPDITQKTKLTTRNYSPSPQLRKKPKIIKDAPVFTRGPVRGECRYPPHEFQDKMLEAQHQQFELYPMGEIADYPRHIPYNSEKKGFLEKTGRESLEVFQYRFKVPGSDNTYSILWDYNIGLVRTTPLFKCTGYSKTTPAKMLNRNPGLREICHSITGGALVAQGYWMPYEAAKAIAATFCWTIRYALTPVFGIDFPNICIHPSSERYGEMLIDPAVTRRCTEQSKIYREIEMSTTRASTATPGPLTPDTPTYPDHLRSLRPKPLQLPSSYDSDSGNDCHSLMSPEVIYRNAWTPTNTPRSVSRLPSPHMSYDVRPPRHDPISRLSSPALSPKSHKFDANQGYDGENLDTERRVAPLGRMNDQKAAYLLMNLRLQGVHKKAENMLRRAST